MKEKTFTVFDPQTGQILGNGLGPELIPNSIWGQYLGIEYWIDPATKQPKKIPPQPHEYFAWNAVAKSWLPDLNRIQQETLKSINTYFSEYDLAPIEYQSTLFDADSTARERITGVLNRLNRGDDLPIGWIGWRDFHNQMQWESEDALTVQAYLAGLSTAIENRSQRLLAVAWQHKANLEAIADVENLLEYDLSTLWEE